MADCIGPHNRGKKGSSCRTRGLRLPGSARLRPGTGDRDRSDSAMGAPLMPYLSLMMQNELQSRRLMPMEVKQD